MPMTFSGSRILLHTSNLTVGYKEGSKENRVLENLNLHLTGGQMICFMGPNGIGKSTLIRTLANLQSPLGGSVVIFNKSVGKNDSVEDLPKRIAVVLTDRISNINLTVTELVTFGRYPYLDWTIKLKAYDKGVIQNALESVHIEHLATRKLYELSDGQLQMAMIARALAQDVDIILLDEPTAHLDLNNRLEVMNLLRNLSRNSGKAILTATHELDLALQTADIIWLADLNKNILTGIPEDLVLDGSFDKIFQFKGFDLKTGKVFHEAYRNISVNLTGQGHEFLWTKNALERSGYTLDIDNNKLVIAVMQHANGIHWVVEQEGKRISHTSLADLLEYLRDLPKNYSLS